jgi:hypothetical protein
VRASQPTPIDDDSVESYDSEDDEETAELKAREKRKRRFRVKKASSFATEEAWELH